MRCFREREPPRRVWIAAGMPLSALREGERELRPRGHLYFSYKNRWCGLGGLCQLCSENSRIGRGADLCVVVEIDIDVARGAPSRRCIWGYQAGVIGLQAPHPQLDPRRPMIERLVGIAGGIELLGAVQPQIDEIGGEVLAVGPRGRVGENQCHPVAVAARRRRGRESLGRISTAWRSSRLAAVRVQTRAARRVSCRAASPTALSLLRGSSERK